MKDKLREMSDKLAVAHVEMEKFDGGNKSAGVRLRGVMQDIKTLATDVRVDVLNRQKGGAA